MRDFNKVNSSLWGSRKFNLLSTPDRLLYLYFLTSPHSNSSGCYRCKIGYIIDDLKMSREDILKGIERVSHTLLICFDEQEEMVFIANWFVFNPPVNPNHAKKILADIVALPKSELKIRTLEDFSAFVKDKNWHVTENLDKIIEGYRKGIERVCHTMVEGYQHRDKTETETKTKTIPDIDQTETKTLTGVKSEIGNAGEIKLAVELFNNLADEVGLTKVQKISDARKSKLKSRLADCGGIDGWKSALEKIGRSDFLRGGGKTGWKADFDFVLQESSFIKIMEGKYDNSKGTTTNTQKLEDMIQNGW